MQVIAKGGKALYGAPLGILMLEARFPRIPGDMGNAATWPFPVLYRVVKGATPERVVLDGAAGLLDDFLAAATELVALGAEAITTNCGFLSLFQAELAAHIRVPVATSALIQGRGCRRCCRLASVSGSLPCPPDRLRRGIWPPPAWPLTRRSSAPKAAASSSAC